MRWNLISGCVLAASTIVVAATPGDFAALSYTDGQGNVLPYRLYSPRNVDPNGKYPVVLFYSGIGGKGSDNLKQLTDQTAVLNLIDPLNQAKWPVFVLAPQNPGPWDWVDTEWSKGSYTMKPQPSWQMAATMTVLNQIVASTPTADSSRLMVTGFSAGGYAAWETAERYPGKFIKTVPVSGGGDPGKASVLVTNNTGVWAFHSADDGMVPVSGSRDMIIAVKTAGGNPSYTEYPQSGHTILGKAYSETGLFPWMFGTTRTPKHKGDGLTGQYFNNQTFSGSPALTRIDPVIDQDWGYTVPASGVGDEHFSVRWTGGLTVDKAEKVTFYMSADDTGTLWIDGTKVVDVTRSLDGEVSGAIDLIPGMHSIKIDYSENTGLANCRLMWSSPTIQKDYIAQEYLSSTVPEPACLSVGALVTMGLLRRRSK